MDPTADEEETERGRGAIAAAVKALATAVAEISGLPDCQGPMRRPYCDLARRVKLLGPLFEEIWEAAGGEGASLGEAEVATLAALSGALRSAQELLRSVNEGSKLYQALHRAQYATRFQEVTEHIGKALSRLSYEKFDISEEVKEQTELLRAQLGRAKERIDSPDLQLLKDLVLVQNEKFSDPIVLERLSEKLQLRTINDLKKESLALHERAISSSVDPKGFLKLKEMSFLLKKLKDSVSLENLTSDTIENKTNFIDYRSPVIPDDFRCPISLELMTDPVIISTGQTYERSCIQKWLDAGHKTCPKTQQNLSHAALIPNFVLKSLIAQWCDANSIELPRKSGSCRDRKPGIYSECDPRAIDKLMYNLESGNQEEQRTAAGELRLLAKRNADNRVCIAEAGAIPLLVELLSSPDPRTQEHAVTALLNLSINDSNKGSIVNARAIPEIVEVLKNGSMEARENAAAALFSLSVVDGNKVTIGAAGAIPALIDLLCQGGARGKKDAATAIFSLSIYQGNKVRAVKAGIVVHLMRMLVDPSGGMVDEALAILAVLVSHQDGRLAIAQSAPIPALLEVMRSGSPRSRENAVAVLWPLCASELRLLKAAREFGAEEALKELAESGTDRAKRKSGNLLELIRRNLEA